MATIRWGIKYTPDKTHDKAFLQEELINDPTYARRGELFLNEPRKTIYFIDENGIIQEINPDFGAFYPGEETVIGTYQLKNKEKILFNSIGGSFNISVPVYESGEDNYFWIINAGLPDFENSIQIVPQLGQTIEGGSVFVLSNTYPSVVFQLVGTDWRIANGYIKRLSGEEIKILYESLGDTNAFTDIEKNKLASMNPEDYLNIVDSVPLTINSPGTIGQIAYDANYQYICVATNSWKRIPLQTW